MRSLSPRYLDASVEEETLKKVHDVSVAAALASIVWVVSKEIGQACYLSGGSGEMVGVDPKLQLGIWGFKTLSRAQRCSRVPCPCRAGRTAALPAYGTTCTCVLVTSADTCPPRTVVSVSALKNALPTCMHGPTAAYNCRDRAALDAVPITPLLAAGCR
jgi:hypothetical protein